MARGRPGCSGSWCSVSLPSLEILGLPSTLKHPNRAGRGASLPARRGLHVSEKRRPQPQKAERKEVAFGSVVE